MTRSIIVECNNELLNCFVAANAGNKYRSTFFLVFDFCEHDLAGLLSNINVKFSLGEIKKVVQQLLNGLYYIHSNKVNIDYLALPSLSVPNLSYWNCRYFKDLAS